MKNTLVLSVVMAMSAIGPDLATASIGSNVTRFSVIAGGFVTDGAGSEVGGEIDTGLCVVSGAKGTSAGNQTDATRFNGALLELRAVQNVPYLMQITSILPLTVSGIISLVPDVCSASPVTAVAGTASYIDVRGLNNPLWVFNIPT